jgi:hypothetical protein
LRNQHPEPIGSRSATPPLQFQHQAGRFPIIAQRAALLRLRNQGEIGDDAFRRIQEELDWAELDAAPAGTFQPLAT